ncbi:MAG: GMP synthase (glutamine-hydrolyzing) [Alphaproteobacteria bacterium]
METILQTILIIDFGSQVTQLIARRVREAGVYSQIIPFSKAQDYLNDHNPKAIILSGSPASVHDDNAPSLPSNLFTHNVPILGICYGQQILTHHFGGHVNTSDQREFGHAALKITQNSPLFDTIGNINDTHIVWMSHGDKVLTPPDNFDIIATSQGAPCAVIAHKDKPIYGVQFHPEVTHSEKGKEIIENFLFKIAHCEANWTAEHFKNEAIKKIQDQVGDKKVICGLSGGVDSAVTAVLIHEAIGDQLTCIFVDHGLLRLNEADTVINLFKQHYQIPLIHVQAQDLFLGKLAGISDPEQKRKIIGGLFIDVFDAEAKKLGGSDFLAQGTLYPDVIESVSFTGAKSVTIKSHHNVGGLPERMNMQLVEPLRELFKDEVRLLGKELGLPNNFIGRHPFPGPGLAIRIPGCVDQESCDILRQADNIFIQEIRKAGLYDAIWQAFAALLPVRSVGVMGDSRTYDRVCALRAVTSIDGMTAVSYPFAHELIAQIATRIINEVKGINRVVYDVTSKPPGTIEWE